MRSTRLVTGLILLTYLSTHLINHALGLISLEAMDAGRRWFLALWRNPFGTVALYVSLLTHFCLALWSLYQRRHLRIPLWEALQLTLGLSIPPLLSLHFVGTRMTHEWFGVEDSYALLVLTLWHASPWDGLKQATLITVAWLHGCIGFHFWLRLRSWYRRAAPVFLGGALLLPVMALLGFSQAGHEVDFLSAQDPNWIARVIERANVPPRSQRESLYRLDDAIILTYVSAILLTLLARVARRLSERRRRIRISYPGGRVVQVPCGFSVLEASRFAGIPHASVCGGRGRCSTCRIRVVQSGAGLPEPSSAEQKLLQRVGAPPNVRLACQLRPTHDLAVRPLLPASALARDGYAQPAYLAGQERTIAVLFADLRSFTGIAEQKLPYDLVFLLNSYFESVGETITVAGGLVDKFIGDGVMALFGIDSGPEQGCRQALAAAERMVERVKTLSESLAEELHEPLRIGVGIHCGPAVVGRMGYGATVHLTAIGDTVNVASRLQDLTKEYNCHLIISAEVAAQSGLAVDDLMRHEITVRNRREALAVFALNDLARIADSIAVAAAVK
ncbi:MAG TPA: adenylate/guanylate cyclase domain-containing protein [Terriglobales bacterium]|nr:adenylate/guanylate cyclase domain-containing protein [Terriglobales bacterium]